MNERTKDLDAGSTRYPHTEQQLYALWVRVSGPDEETTLFEQVPLVDRLLALRPEIKSSLVNEVSFPWKRHETLVEVTNGSVLATLRAMAQEHPKLSFRYQLDLALRLPNGMTAADVREILVFEEGALTCNLINRSRGELAWRWVVNEHFDLWGEAQTRADASSMIRLATGGHLPPSEG